MVMFKFRNTVQGRISRALCVVVAAAVILSGISVYAIFAAQNSAKMVNEELSRNNKHFLELRIALEQTISSFELIGVSKGTAGLQHLEAIRKAKDTFINEVETMEKESANRSWATEVSALKPKFEAANALGREGALAVIENRAEKAAAKNEGLAARLAELRLDLDRLSTVISTHFQDNLARLLHSLIMLLLPVALIAVAGPPIYIWVITKKLNRELLQFARNLNGFSIQNDQTSVTLKAASENLSSSSSEQSAAVQETVASIAQIRSMLSQTANHVREVQNLTSTVKDKTQNGSQTMSRMEASMIAIEQANSQLQSLEEIIRSIKEKTQVINDIVFKTQLLSFNASIEAARAGQYGRGFAVVAEEVGKLAQMSGSASKEIDQLLSDSQKQVSKIVEAVQVRVRDGKEVSGEALKRFGEIAKQIGAISDKVNQVGEATLEQEGGVEQTARAMDQMDEVALHNKKSAEDTFQVADQVQQISTSIRELTLSIRKYVQDDGQEDSHAHTSATPAAQVSDKNSISHAEVLSMVQNMNKRTGRTEPSRDAAGKLTADDPSFRKSGTEG
jgi:methyl-accepting chemotaxis protein